MTFYEILGVSKNASQEEIRNAYKTLVKKYHPDLYQGDKSFAEKKTQEINEAYDILSDSEKRINYDTEINPSSYSGSYNYTPPKYSSDYNPYTSYQNRYSYTAKSNKYENYHSSKTPNSDYHNQGDVVFDSFARKLGTNFLVIIVVFIFYLIIFIATLLQYNSYKKEQKTKELNKSFNNTINETTNTLDNTNNEFNINDYITDSELRQVYYKYYTDSYESYEEFKEDFSDYIEYYLSSY